MPNSLIEAVGGGRSCWGGENQTLDGKCVMKSEIKEYPDGSRFWYLDGKLHRTDGPAAEGSNGSREWWVNGKLHRTDGPAVKNVDGPQHWWINGIKYHTKEHGLAAGKL